MGRAGRRTLTAALLALAGPQVAYAQDTARSPDTARAPEPPSGAAEELIAQGVALRKQGEDAQALALFERAYALLPSPRAIAQVALAHQALGHWREAESGLIEVLGHADDAWVATNRAYLEESLATVQGHLAWLEVDSNVAGAELWVGGRLVGRTPLDRPLRVEAGELAMSVRAPGFSPIERRLPVEPRSRVYEVFTFASQPAPVQPSAPSPTVTAAAPWATVARSASPPAPGARTAGWITLAGAGGLLLTGVAGLITREWEALIYDDDGQCGPTATLSRYERCGTHRDIGSAAQTVAVVAFIGSGTAAAASAVLLLGGSHPSAPRPPRSGCRVAGLGVSCGGAF
jgi:hypothetical protein